MKSAGKSKTRLIMFLKNILERGDKNYN